MTYGAFDMLSIPPATMMSDSPARISEEAIITAFSPEPQTLLIVVAATVSGSPPFSAAWRAGACPVPPCSTWPIRTSSIDSGGTPALRTASRTAIPPRSEAERLASPPWNLPIGVRAAERRTTSRGLFFTWLIFISSSITTLRLIRRRGQPARSGPNSPVLQPDVRPAQRTGPASPSPVRGSVPHPELFEPTWRDQDFSTSLAITVRWISEVPSPISSSFASRK